MNLPTIFQVKLCKCPTQLLSVCHYLTFFIKGSRLLLATGFFLKPHTLLVPRTTLCPLLKDEKEHSWMTQTHFIIIKCWFYFRFFFSFWIFFPKSLDNFDKIATCFILLKLTMCLLLFQISCGGKSCALLTDRWRPNDKSSFKTNKKEQLRETPS